MQPLIEKKNTEKQKRDISVNKHRQYMTKKNPYSSIEEYGLIVIFKSTFFYTINGLLKQNCFSIFATNIK